MIRDHIICGMNYVSLRETAFEEGHLVRKMRGYVLGSGNSNLPSQENVEHRANDSETGARCFRSK